MIISAKKAKHKYISSKTNPNTITKTEKINDTNCIKLLFDI